MFHTLRAAATMACLVALLSGCGETSVGTLTYDMQINSDEAVYERIDAPEDVGFVFKQATGRTTIRIKIAGTGEFAYSDSDQTTVDTDVPGVSDEGYSRLTLRKEADGRFILVDEQLLITNPAAAIIGEDNWQYYVDEPIEQPVHERPISISAEVQFVEGSWQDIAAGKPATFKYTDAGLAELERVFTDVVKDDIVRGMDAGYGSYASQWRMDAKVEHVSLANDVFEFDGKTVKYKTSTPQKIVIRLRCYEQK